MSKILVIPDVQIKPDINLAFIYEIGLYIVDKKPDVVVCLGDFFDFPSLSSYDKGKLSFEGRRLQDDIATGQAAMEMMLRPLRQLQTRQQQNKKKVYRPRLVFTLGNHEERLSRLSNEMPELAGFVGYNLLDLEKHGWEVYDFLKPVEIDGIYFCHYMQNHFTGKPLAGSALNQLKTVGRSFVVGHKQILDVAMLPTIDGDMRIGIVAGACLEENHKVLTADLQYVRLGTVKVGDELVSFEENVTDKRSRRYQKGTVLAVRKKLKETMKVTLASGKSFIVTEDHRWFVKTGGKYRWVETTGLRKGTCIPKLLPEWETDNTFEGGWLSGMYDGEGWLSSRDTTGGKCFQLGICQNEGLVLDKIKRVLDSKFGFGNTTYTRSDDNTQLRVKGGVSRIIKVLGSLRPIRLMAKFDPDCMGRICCSDGNNDKVVSIESAGQNTVVEIDIDKKTMVVEGYGHHNCYPHDEAYKGHQGNHHWRGLFLLHNCKNGYGDPCFVSLDYLKNRYRK